MIAFGLYFLLVQIGSPYLFQLLRYKPTNIHQNLVQFQWTQSLRCYIRLLCFDIFLHANNLHSRGNCVGIIGAGLRAAKVMSGTHFSTKLCTIERLRTTIQPSKGEIPGTLQTHVDFSHKNTSLIYERSKTPLGDTPGTLAASNVFIKADAESKHFSQGPKCSKKCLHT